MSALYFILISFFISLPLNGAKKTVRFDEESNTVHTIPRYISENEITHALELCDKIARRLPDEEFEEYHQHAHRQKELLSKAARMPSETIQVRIPDNISLELKKEVKVCLGFSGLSLLAFVLYFNFS